MHILGDDPGCMCQFTSGVVFIFDIHYVAKKDVFVRGDIECVTVVNKVVFVRGDIECNKKPMVGNKRIDENDGCIGARTGGVVGRERVQVKAE